MYRPVDVRVLGMLAMVLAIGLSTRSFAQDARAPHRPTEGISLSTASDSSLSARLQTREADWRNGAIVYQVFVDRFAPSANLNRKRNLYASPRTLRDWSDQPTRGKELRKEGLWSHELDFWGGDLQSLHDKLPYVVELGADVLYLNPIFSAFTNHKYDADDYLTISEEYGTRQDLLALIQACHAQHLKLMLDGVFNHMGRRNNVKFQEALKNPNSPERNWFVFDRQFEHGYRAWYNVANLPELNLENSEVRQALWGAPNSVVQSYLRDGIDGWRLDVAYDLGFTYLEELTKAAHAAKAGSCVVGEIWCYPEEWCPSVDGVMNFYVRQLILDLVEGKLSGRLAGRSIERMVADTGLDPILKSWMLFDNHDTRRLHALIPNRELRRLAQVLQFTLPGSPVIYYGTELGMSAADGDPANRAPMRWDLANDKNAELLWMKQLVKLRKDNRALRIGDFRLLDTEKLLAFSRRTERIGECVIVVANASATPVREVFGTREAKLMNGSRLQDQIDKGVTAIVSAGLVEIEVPAKTIRVLKLIEPNGKKEYSPYKRVP